MKVLNIFSHILQHVSRHIQGILREKICSKSEEKELKREFILEE
jgi:hypothetical protein